MRYTWNQPLFTTSVEFLYRGEEKRSPRLFTGKWRNPFIISDRNVWAMWRSNLEPMIGDAFGVHLLEASENLKNPETLLDTWKAMRTAGITRDVPIAVIGGGLVCDLGAMAASTYLRGLPLILVPTTLLAMVDACLGGKTGVNLGNAKNQVGTFYPAERVIVNVSFLGTLSPREFRSGLAEVLKTSLIGDPGMVKLVRNITPGDLEPLEDMVRRCLSVKASVVSGDLKDTGGRMILNTGHTIGHALESIGGFNLSHGEAVGLGLVAEAAMASSLGGRSGLIGEIRELLAETGLPYRLVEKTSLEEIRGMLSRDKKTMRKQRTWALPFDWGDCRLVELSPDEEYELVSEALELLE